ncbi:MAG: hypothetical protein HY315_01520 [Acidobacteria bacterium]|nr:hypothetical protein [Acidobacteriota bacterium]
MKRFWVSVAIVAQVVGVLYGDRVFSRFDPSSDPLTVALNLRFDVNAVAADNFFSPSVLFSADGKRCFVNFPGSDAVVVFDADTMAAIAVLFVGKNPAQMAMTPDKQTIVVVNTHLADNAAVVPKLVGSISLINAKTLVARTAALDKVNFSLGSNVVFTPDSQTGFVASTGTGEVVRFRVPEGTEIQPRLKLAAGSRPVNLAIARNGSFFTVVNVGDLTSTTVAAQDSISVVDVATFGVRLTITPKEAHDFVATHNVTLTPDDAKGIIGDQGSSNGVDDNVAYVFSTGTGEILKRIALGANVFSTAVTPDGTRFLVVGSSELSFLSTDTLELQAQLIAPIDLFGIGGFTQATNVISTADSSTAYIASPGSDLAFRIDLNTNSIAAATQTSTSSAGFGNSPFLVALTPDEQQVAVLNFGSSSIDFLRKTFAFGVPRFYSDKNHFTNLTLANVGTAPTNVMLEARAASGSPFIESERTEVSNPRSLDLSPGRSAAGLASVFFRNDPVQSPLDGSILVESTQPTLIGYFQISISDFLRRKTDGANLTRSGSFSLVLPVVRQDDAFSTELVVASPGTNLNTAGVQISLIDMNGASLATVSDSIAPGGVLSRKLKSDDPNVADYLPQAIGLQGAHLVIISTEPVNALGLYETADELSVLPATAPSNAAVADGIQLAAPQVTLLGGYRTVLSLVNGSDGGSDTALVLVDDKGALLADPQVVSLSGSAGATLDLADLFGLDGSAPISGWLGVYGTNSRMVASIEMFGFDGKAFSAYPLTESSGTDFYFAHLSQGVDFSTQVSLVNPNNQGAEVTLDLFSAEGSPVAARRVTLGPNARLSDSVSALFGIPSQEGGRIRVRSNVAISALEMIVATDLQTSSVVPPQSTP